MDKKHDIWAVAAAYLLLDDNGSGPFHYTTIADWIEASGLTTLGLKGDTPRQTVRAILGKHSDVFARYDEGDYGLNNPLKMARDYRVMAALESVKQLCMARHAAAQHSDQG